MKQELIQYHTEELSDKREHLASWEDAPDDYDPTAVREHIEHFKRFVDLHERALNYLRSLPDPEP